MHKLFILADPASSIEIFELTKTGQMHKISQLRLPQESIEFIKNYSNSVGKKIDVTYIGPNDYIKYFVNQANKLEFVKAHMNETGEEID